MNRFYTLIMAVMLPALFSAAATTSRIYGIRVYSETPQDVQTLVSFSADNPGNVRTEMVLDGLNIKAAAGYDGKYYMFHSDDDMLVNRIYCLDMERMQLSLVKELDYKFDLAANILFTDAAYNSISGNIIVAGYNVGDGQIVDGELDAPFGLYNINPLTGEGSVLSQQNQYTIMSLVVDPDGFMYGIDETSTMWDIDLYSGYFNMSVTNLGFSPVGVQSMAFDYGKKDMYYAGYTADSNGKGLSKLFRIYMNENYEFISDEIGSIGNQDELIGLYIDSDPANDAAPSRITGFTATRGEKGALSALLAWKNPSATVGGTPLQDMDVNIYRDNELLTTLKSATPGADMTWTDNEVSTGMHSYSLTAVNADGESDPILTDPEWFGVDTPDGPATVTAVKAADSHVITVSWTAPSEGEHGGWFDASQVRYNVVRQPGAKQMLSSSTDLSLTDSDTDVMHGYIYEVTAVTDAGTGGMTASAPVISGNPHNVPYISDFNDPDIVNQWTVVNADNDQYAWYPETAGWGGTYDVFFRYYPESLVNPAAEMNDWLISPAINLEAGKKYVVKYDLRLLGDLFPADLTLAIGDAPVPAAMTTELEKLDGHINDIEWVKHSIPFTVEKTGAYHFGYQVRNAVPVQFYNFEVIETADVDLAAISMSGNDLLSTGEAHQFEVVVANRGFNDIDSYTVSLVDAEGNTLASEVITTPLASQQTAKVTIEWTPQTEGSYEISACVKAEGDTVADNDTTAPVKVSVLGNVTSIDITEGKIPTGYAPIYCSYKNSAVQTIYTPEKIGKSGKMTIKALIYYIYRFNGTGKTDINLEVALGNTDKADFADKQMVPMDRLSAVYNHSISLSPEQKTMTIVFDEPFVYEGGNLCVFTRHSSENTANMMFYAEYSSSDKTSYTALYRGDTPFDFSQEVNGVYRDLPNVSLLVTPEESGINDVTTGSDAQIVYSRQARMLNIVGDYDKCDIYSVAGTLIGSYSGVDEISLENFPTGVAIVKVTSENGVTTTKIVI